MKINISPTSGDITIFAESSDSFNSFGGEYWDDISHYAEYGLDLGDISINSISPKQFKQLAISMINHLMINGHDFSIGDDVNGSYIRSIN